MTGWVFAFAVNMAKATVEEGTDEHKQAAASIDQPGNYSISRLYLDFNCKLYMLILTLYAASLTTISSESNRILQV